MTPFIVHFLLRLQAPAWLSTKHRRMIMKRSSFSGGKALYAILALPLLLSMFLFTPLAATQRMVLVEDWENTS